jgi:tetratricopeptide (TPR) repeat protein
MIVIVAASAGGLEYATDLERTLSSRGFSTWLEDRDVFVGDLRIQALDSALRGALALVLVGPISQNTLYERLTYANWGAVGLGVRTPVVYVPSDSDPMPSSLSPLVTRLPRNLAPEDAATAVHEIALASSPRVAGRARTPGILRPGSWALAGDISDYGAYPSLIEALLRVGDFDQARHYYWHSVYTSGYREQWQPRVAASSSIVRAAIKEDDLLTAGMVTVKGLAYPHIEMGNTARATELLRQGASFLRAAGSRAELGVVWSYSGDMAKLAGDARGADSAYNEAIDLLMGVERHQVDLKRRWHRLTADGPDISSREALEGIQKELGAIFDYREGLVSLDLARLSAAEGNLEQAVLEARSGLELLETKIGMPRNALRARALVTELSIRQAQPMRTELLSRRSNRKAGGIETPPAAREQSSIGHWLAIAKEAGHAPRLADLSGEENAKSARLERLAHEIGLPVYDSRTFLLPDEEPACLAFAQALTRNDEWYLAVRVASGDRTEPTYRRLGLDLEGFQRMTEERKGEQLTVSLAPYRLPARSVTVWSNHGDMLLEMVEGPHYWVTKSPPSQKLLLRCSYGPLSTVVKYSTGDMPAREMLYRTLVDVTHAVLGMSPRGCREREVSFYAEFHWHRDVGYRFIECSFSPGWL